MSLIRTATCEAGAIAEVPVHLSDKTVGIRRVGRETCVAPIRTCRRARNRGRLVQTSARSGVIRHLSVREEGRVLQRLHLTTVRPSDDDSQALLIMAIRITLAILVSVRLVRSARTI
jgi:hypothetical protein